MKIYSSFTEEIHNILQGNFSQIAEKHQVSSKYVSLISNQKREVKSQKAKLILKDLEALLKVLSPTHYEAYSNELKTQADEIL